MRIAWFRSTAGFQPLMVPSRVPKRKTAGADLPQRLAGRRRNGHHLREHVARAIVKGGHPGESIRHTEGAVRGKVHPPTVQVGVRMARHTLLKANQIELLVAAEDGSIFEGFEPRYQRPPRSSAVSV